MYNILISALQRILKNHKIANVDFIFLAQDNLSPSEEAKLLLQDAPIFLMSKNMASAMEKDKLLLPDAYILSNKIWQGLISKISHAVKSHPWEAKNSDQIFWRGSSTGGNFTLENYDKLKRLTLVMLSKSFPDKIDAAFTNYVQFPETQGGQDLLMILKKLFGNDATYLNPIHHLKYKYLISIDGNTCAWGRVPWILLSNSVLLKQETSFTEIFYSGLQPFVHYVPLNADLSDIFEKLLWLQANDDKAKEISYNATKFIEENLKPQDIEDYTIRILNEYSKLQNFEITTPVLPLVK
jgi:hypothetical protein